MPEEENDQKGRARKGKKAPYLQKTDADKASDAAELLSDIERPLPFSDDAERAVLSCMLQMPEPTINEAVEKLHEESFYSPGNRLLFALMVEIYNSGKPIEPMTLTQTLVDRNKLESVGGAAGVASIYDFVPVAAHFDFYADVVREKAVLRRVITACSESIKDAYDTPEEVGKLLDNSEQRILAIRMEDEKGTAIKSLGDRVMDAIDEIEQMIKNPDSRKGVPTGFSEFDKMTNGLKGGEMIVVAARPSMGKTSFVMNIVEHAAVDKGHPCAVFSLEMTAQQLVHRLLCARGGLSMQNLQGGLLSRDDQRRLTQAATELTSAEIIIDDTPGLSILEVRAKARRYKLQYGIKMIAIDYLQLLSSSSRKAQDNRQVEIAEISAGLKALSKELDLPIIVLAQLNRAVEQRKGGRPMLSDLRESGSIEQDADCVGLLTRSDYAGSKGRDGEEEEELDPEEEGKALLIVAKQRNGPTGDVPLKFISENMRFIDREPDRDEEF